MRDILKRDAIICDAAMSIDRPIIDSHLIRGSAQLLNSAVNANRHCVALLHSSRESLKLAVGLAPFTESSKLLNRASIIAGLTGSRSLFSTENEIFSLQLLGTHELLLIDRGN